MKRGCIDTFWECLFHVAVVVVACVVWKMYGFLAGAFGRR